MFAFTAQTVTKIISYKVHKFWPVWSSTKHICNDTIMEVWCRSENGSALAIHNTLSYFGLCSQGKRLSTHGLCSWHRCYYRPTGGSLTVQVTTPVGRRGLVWGTHTTKEWAKENIMKRCQWRQRTLKSWNHSDWLVTDWLVNSSVLNSQRMNRLPHHVEFLMEVLVCTYSWGRLKSSFCEGADSSQSIIGLTCRNEHGHLPNSRTIIFNSIEEVASVAQSRWESFWETDETVSKAKMKCAKKINK